MDYRLDKVWKKLEISEEETLKSNSMDGFEEIMAGASAIREKQELKREAASDERLEVTKGSIKG